MDELLREELEELKYFFKKIDYVDRLFLILFILEDIKPGADLTAAAFTRERKKLDKLINLFFRRKKSLQLRNMLKWFNLYVSEYDFYVSKNKRLCDEWDDIRGNIAKLDNKADRFFGYPACCSKIYNEAKLGGVITILQLYPLIKEVRVGKKSVGALTIFVTNSRFIHHARCKINCEESILLERKYEEVIKKYYWLVKELLRSYYKKNINFYITGLKNLPKTLKREEYRNKLRDASLSQNLGINIEDLKEIFENGRAFKENLKFGVKILHKLY